MKTIRNHLQLIAAISLLSFIHSLVLPASAFANGPYQSEFTSGGGGAGHQVNPVTGDFSYNLPLLNVPGPGGGYPISMSYNSGIKVDQPATWAGLGWNVGPGAISRQVVKHPDDAKGNLSCNFGYKLIAGDQVSNTFTQSASLFEGMVAYNEAHFWGTGYDGGYNSLAVSGLKVSDSYGSNNPYRGVTASTKSAFSGNLELYAPGIGSFGMSYERLKADYFVASNSEKYNYGILYSKDGIQSLTSNGTPYYAPTELKLQHPLNSMDAYSNPYNKQNGIDLSSHEDGANLSMPATDRFLVSVPGIGGSFEPSFNTTVTIPRDMIKEAKYYTYTPGSSAPNNGKVLNGWYYHNADDPSHVPNSADIHFQYLSEPASYYLQDFGSWQTGSFVQNSNNYPVSSAAFTQGTADKQNFNSARNKRGTSTNIEWFSNQEIASNLAAAQSRGYLKYSSSEHDRLDTDISDPDGIGAFIVTDINGTSYHFTIPVYQYEQFSVFENKTKPEEDFAINMNLDKYATHWLLTAITGPNYVDKGGVGNSANGYLDDNDQGYWVKFDYGKWTDGYIWRSPHSGYIDNPFDTDKGTFSFGRKQIWYLNSIETATHKALFLKDIREDEKGAGVNIDPMNYPYYQTWTAKDTLKKLSFAYNNPGNNKLLKLNKVVLLSKADLATDDVLPSEGGSLGGLTNSTGSFNFKWHEMNLNAVTGQYVSTNLLARSGNFDNYYVDHVIDEADWNAHLLVNPNFEDFILNEAELFHNYDLAQGTPNSDAVTQGKLTLEKVAIHGKGGAKIMPSYKFFYKNHAGYVYDRTAADDWGYYAKAGIRDLKIDKDICDKPQIDNWNLEKIQMPMGGFMEIKYEPDVYSREAVLGSGKRISLPSPQYDNGSNQIYLEFSQDEMEVIACAAAVGDPIELHKTIDEEDVCQNTGNTSTQNQTCNIQSIDLNNNRIYLSNNGNCGTFWETSTSTSCTIRIVMISAEDFVKDLDAIGGGLRVKELITHEGSGAVYTTKYDYSNPETGRNSGVTSYAPLKEARFIPYVMEVPGPGVMYEYVTITSEGDNGNIEAYSTTQFEVLGTASSMDDYEFQIGNHFEAEDITGNATLGYFDSDFNVLASNQQIAGAFESSIYKREAIIHDKSLHLGRPLKAMVYDKTGVMISKEEYEYYDHSENVNGVDYTKHGIHQTTHNSVKSITQHNWLNNGFSWNHHDYYFVSTSKKIYPSILKSVKTTAQSVSNVNYYENHDPTNGASKVTRTVNGYGEHVKSETYFAHEDPNFSPMGPKSLNLSNNNFLAVPIYSVSYTSPDGVTWSPIAAAGQTWSNDLLYREVVGNAYAYVPENNSDLWLPSASYVWKGFANTDGTSQNFVAFDPQNPLANGWELESEMLFFDRNSKVLELQDINGIKGTTKFGYGLEQRPLAFASNAKYSELAYSGAEDFNPVTNGFGSEVKKAGGTVYDAGTGDFDDPFTHTGQYSLAVANNNEEGFTYEGSIGNAVGNDFFISDRKYRASVWVKVDGNFNSNNMGELFFETNNCGSNPNACGSVKIGEEIVRADGWMLLNIDIDLSQDPNAAILKIGVRKGAFNGTLYMDDFRVHPLDAPMKSFVYDPWTGEIIATLNEDNIGTKYVYDSAGREIRKFVETQEGFRLISESKVGYESVLE